MGERKKNAVGDLTEVYLDFGFPNGVLRHFSPVCCDHFPKRHILTITTRDELPVSIDTRYYSDIEVAPPSTLRNTSFSMYA
jgi:hypothetical protein